MIARDRTTTEQSGTTNGWLRRYFDHIIVISLPHRTDRRKRIQRELAKIGIEIGRTPGVEFFDAIRPSEADGFPSATKRGCFLSHFSIVKRAQNEGWDRVLILEDDAVFTPAITQCGERLVQLLEYRPWHIAFFGYLNVRLPKGDPNWLPLDKNRFGTHCYALNRDILPALVKYMELVETREPGHPDGARVGADATYAMFGERTPWCTTLMARPNLAIQGSSASDLSPRWFDQIPVLRQSAALARWARSSITGYPGR